MNVPIQLLNQAPPFPDHTQLPDKDGSHVRNAQEPAQSQLLTTSLEPVLQILHPDGAYFVGTDIGIYWLPTNPAMQGCKAPDWLYVPDAPPLPPGQYRRSYVLWHEILAPLIVLEYLSDSDGQERNQTPLVGKWWVYERGIRIPYYGLYDCEAGRVEVFCLDRNRYHPLPANERGHFPIKEMGVELGIWQGRYETMELPWLRWWDDQGRLLPTPEERIQQQADRAQRLAARLRELGVDPEQI